MTTIEARVTATATGGLARLLLVAVTVLGAAACAAGSAPAGNRPAGGQPAGGQPEATPGHRRPHRPPSGLPAAAQRATVARIVDGDTIRVTPTRSGGRLPADAAHEIRLLEYDAPETTAAIQCGGPAATAALRRLIPVGSTVHLTADRQDTDRYGRFLRYVHTDDGTFVNAAMVRRGHGHAVMYPPNDAHITVMRRAERAARAAERGVWGPPCAWDGG